MNFLKHFFTPTVFALGLTTLESYAAGHDLVSEEVGALAVKTTAQDLSISDICNYALTSQQNLRVIFQDRNFWPTYLAERKISIPPQIQAMKPANIIAALKNFYRNAPIMQSDNEHDIQIVKYSVFADSRTHCPSSLNTRLIVKEHERFFNTESKNDPVEFIFNLNGVTWKALHLHFFVQPEETLDDVLTTCYLGYNVKAGDQSWGLAQFAENGRNLLAFRIMRVDAPQEQA